MLFPSKLLAGAILGAAGILAAAAQPQADDQPGADVPRSGTAAPSQVPPVPVQAAVPGTAAAADDETFLLLHEAARQDDAAKANALASRLPNYGLASYVDYYRLKPRLREASGEEIRAFLRRYDGSAIAERMRNEWLLELGRARDWANFDRELAQLKRNDDTQLRCYALLARAQKGENVAGQARKLLVYPPGYGDACNGLLVQLGQSGQFTQADLLAQLRLAGEMHATGPARRAALLLGGSDTRAAQAVDLPAVAMARGIGKTRVEREIYLVAVGRMARTSLNLATVALKKNERRLSPGERAIGWSNVALAASIALAPQAWDYWKKAKGAPLSAEQMQWKTRVALRRGDWKAVRSGIEAMPARLRSDMAWVYWRGRAMLAQGEREDAHEQFRRIASQDSFYGQLAMEELGEQVEIPPAADPPTPAELAQVAANPDLRRALKFFSLGLRVEGNREWSWGLRDFTERQLLAAAELARKNNILDRMIETSVRTRTELDYAQRFPAPHADIMHPTAKDLGLDQAWVYGLIRQESRFISDARSGVGASGLMQVMPGTGKWVAAKLGLTDFVHGMLNDLRTNITLGANYMNMVLANADGSQVLASAAYNAGPSRMRRWRAALDAPMEGAIFVESIPFYETRNYVRNVMSNATNYAALFDKRPQSLKARLGTIAPRAGANVLP